MYKYTKSMLNKFKYPFPGIERIEENYSQSLQDMFVLSALSGQMNGNFLEIGAFHPTFISNTYLLEKEFNWSGVSVDINPVDFSSRRSRFMMGDATQLDWYRILSDNFGERIDYLSLDIEPNTNTLACLKKLPLDSFRFSVITYETDFYADLNEELRQESRDIFNYYGYALVAGNISNLTDDAPFEDWYLDGTFFDPFSLGNFWRFDSSPIAAHKYMGLA